MLNDVGQKSALSQQSGVKVDLSYVWLAFSNKEADAAKSLHCFWNGVEMRSCKKYKAVVSTALSVMVLALVACITMRPAIAENEIVVEDSIAVQSSVEAGIEYHVSVGSFKSDHYMLGETVDLQSLIHNDKGAQWTIDRITSYPRCVSVNGNTLTFIYEGSGYIHMTLRNVSENTTDSVVYDVSCASHYYIGVGEGIEHGTVSVDKAVALYGETVTVTVVPDEGFQLDRLDKILTGRGGSYTGHVAYGGRNAWEASTYTFTVEDYDVLVVATFKERDPKPIPVPYEQYCTYDGTKKVGIKNGEGYKLSGTYRATKAGTYTAVATLDPYYKWYDDTTTPKKITWSIRSKLVMPEISLKKASYVYTSKTVTPKVSVTVDGSVLKKGRDYDVTYDKGRKRVGLYNVFVSLKGNYSGNGYACFKIKKAANPLTATAMQRLVKYAKVKKQQVTVSCPIKLSDSKGKITYTKIQKGSSKRLNVNAKTGAVTVKKGTKKGTYKIKIQVNDVGNANYKSIRKTVVCKVTVQ